MKTLIHPTAIVHPEAQLANDVEIGPWTLIGPHVRIGKGTQVASHVVIEGHTTIGEENRIFSFAAIGGKPQDLKYKGEDTRLVIGDRNTIRESVTLNLGTVQGGGVTQIGNGNLLMAYVHVGHDCVIGNSCVLSNALAVAGHVTIEDHATIGGMVGIAQFVRVGSHAYVVGQSGVEKDVPPFAVAYGSRPCVLRGINIVGLKRKGIKTETIQALQESFRIWVNPELKKEEALAQIEERFVKEIPEAGSFVNFIRKSEGGVIKLSRLEAQE